MKTKHCNICNKQTIFKRHLGIGTLIAVIVTLGWWVLAIPFYPVRCTYCGEQRSSGRPKDLTIEILKKRYARGEINKEEFEEKKRDLDT